MGTGIGRRAAILGLVAVVAFGGCTDDDEERTAALCTDGLDNDNDGLTDCGEPACKEIIDCTAATGEGCGDGIITPPERCDTAISAGTGGACPTACEAEAVCSKSTLRNPGTCDAICGQEVIAACASGDGCCPAVCTADNDDDCSATCGNGTLEPLERCDTKIAAGNPGACPTACDDGNACTSDALLNAGSCGALCAFDPKTQCASGDGCCPAGCNANSDDDCSATCGNGQQEPGEQCDTAIPARQPGGCPSDCDDQNACTADHLLNGGTCGAVCTNRAINACKSGDGCCPGGCDATTDNDCSATCGNGVLEPLEQCDTKLAAGQAGACPSSCDDKNACTNDVLLNGGTCGALCTNTGISQCAGGDGCCPSGCNANSDSDCSASCGNGVVEPGEQCDTKLASDQPGACPSGCDDKNACTNDVLLNAGTCGAVCTNAAISQCTGGDGCCPAGCNANSDSDCSATCGNGVAEPGEQCDSKIAAGQAGACPTDCGDKNACTSDVLLNGGTCGAVCTNTAISQCANGDGCCPTGCNANSDDDCSPTCGNGAVEAGEKCDSKIAAGQAGACPTDCGDKNACTSDVLLNGGTCGAVCTNTAISQCSNGDGCCPTGCNANSDDDCSPTCGNGVLEEGEKCDSKIAAGQAGACPTGCDDKNACTKDALLNGGTCAAVCTNASITQCSDGDGCCPTGCNANSDDDCSPTCGNGVLEAPEKCDSKIAAGQAGACPTACDDKNACTSDVLLNGGTCGAVCTNGAITECADGDGCCPGGCNANNDGDCSPSCGNGVLEAPEKCDTKIPAGTQGACPTNCDDGVDCTVDTLLNGGTCGAVCTNAAITQCANKDGCCPGGCNANNDSDCSPSCGNGVLEAPEKCDTKIPAGVAGACPTSCSDGVACTSDLLLNAGTCGATCSFPAVTQCLAGDKCCPPGCDANTDSDCSPLCGNGVVEPGEQCDTEIPPGDKGACPTFCSDGKPCTDDVLLQPGGCGAQCSFPPVTKCLSADKCCPSGCDANTDGDCDPVCGNGVLEAGERCDPKIPVGVKGACPTDCDDKNACTEDKLADPGTCLARCLHSSRTCDDGNPCTEDTCDPETGKCIFPDKVCDDKNACTWNVCDKASGKCIFPAKLCTSTNLCETASCNKFTGQCQTMPILCLYPQVCDPKTGKCSFVVN